MEALVGKRIRPLTALSPDLAESEPGRSPGSSDGMLAFNQVIDSVRKYRRLVVMMVTVGTLLVTAASLLIPPSYMASAQLAVDIRQPGTVDARGTTGVAPALTASAEEAIIDTHVTVLLSDAYLRSVLPTLSTLGDAGNRDRAEAQTWAQQLRALVGSAWSAMLFKKPATGEVALAALKRSLRVGQERRSRIIAVTALDRDPQRAAEIANTVAHSYVDEVTRQKRGDVEQTLRSLSTLSSKIQNDLAKAQEELKASRPDQAASSRETLESQVTTLAQQFETLLRRRQELTVQSLIVDPDVSLLAAASPPERPSSLNPLFVVPPAAIAFALLGCALAVILNRFDRTLHTETEATEALRIPCVGSIPPIPPELAKQPQYALGQPASDYAKAVRSILVSVLASGPAAPRAQRTILLSSSAPGEGKTTLAWSLCLWAARLGLRTLLLDAGQLVSRRVDESASLLNSLTLDRPLADVIEPIQDLGIDYLPAGFSDGNRLRVLTSPKISPLLRQMGEAYDLVVIDGPSLQEAPEARLLAGWVDHVLLVIRCGTTYRETAQTALHQLARTEHLNTAQTARFSSVLTRAEPPSQYNVLGRRAGLLKQIWSAMSRRRRQLPLGATEKPAAALERSARLDLRSRTSKRSSGS
jgi:succinoglycan biosynthesis transport protein ExoP